MSRTLPIVAFLFALSAGGIAAQAAVETLVPRGQLRLQFDPSFTVWNSRFGQPNSTNGVVLVESVRESLGSDLTDPIGTSLFPAITRLEDEIRSLTGQEGYSGVLGEARGLITYDITRIDVGGQVGVFDWLTVGVVAPFVKARTALDVTFSADPAAADLGLNPTISEGSSVSDFLTALLGAQESAQGRADFVCAADPGAACTGAQSLADRVGSFHSSSQTAYSASGFFPMHGSSIATSLSDALTSLDQEMIDAGLAGIGTEMAFASEYLTGALLLALPSQGAAGIQGQPLSSIDGIYKLGDVEVSALARIAESAPVDPDDLAPRYSYEILGGVLGRLGTGKVDAHDVFVDLGTGDGQVDIEARVIGFLGIGPRLGIRASVQYGIQRPTSLLRRVAIHEVVMPPASTLRAVRWSPGAYLGIGLEPVWRLSPELTVFGSYRLYSKGDDSYEIFGEVPAGATQVDSADLERETSMTLHQLGLGLRYSTVEPWKAGVASRPMELHAGMSHSIAGSGGRTPVSTRIEFGIRLFRQIWGGATPEG
jgi:hypothetical protein